MAIKAILYDLDNTLVDLSNSHYVALNIALKEIAKTEISQYDHENTFNGLTTKTKLEKLTELGLVKIEDHKAIFDRKQKYTAEAIEETLNFDYDKVKLHSNNKWNHLKSVVVSNSITQTCVTALNKTGQLDYIDFIVSNEVVSCPKPSSMPWIFAMVKLGFYPEECVIVEDSPIGIQSATPTGCHIWHVKDSHEVNWENFQKFMFNIRAGNMK